MPETEQHPRSRLDRRSVAMLELFCGVATAAFFVGELADVSRWVLLALSVPTMLGYALGLARYRRRRAGASVFSKNPDDYR